VKHYLLLLLALAVPVFAQGEWTLASIHDTRYNLFPEIMVPDQAEFSGGFQTKWVGDGDFVGTVKFGINDRVEVGTKLSYETENQWDRQFLMADLGVKVAINAFSSIQSDVILGINNGRGGGVMLTYSQGAAYSKRFSSTYEARLGFLEAVTVGNWAIMELGTYPQFRIADPVALRIGLATATSLRHPVDQFKIDLLPGVTIGLRSYLKLLGECAVGIIGTKEIRLSLHVVSQF
jgi:hypothetical protein